MEILSVNCQTAWTSSLLRRRPWCGSSADCRSTAVSTAPGIQRQPAVRQTVIRTGRETSRAEFIIYYQV